MLRGDRDADLQKFIFQEARKELTTNAKTALGALSFFVPSATFEAWMQVAELSRNALETTIDRLSALSLVDVLAGEERYALHPLTRAFARDELLADANVARDTGMRFAKYWVDYAKRYGGEEKESYKTYDRLEAEWMNLGAAANWLWETASVQGESVRDKDAARMLNDLVSASGQFLWFGGRWDEVIDFNGRAYEVALAIQDWSGAGWHARDVFWINYNRSQTNDAKLWADRCTAVWTRGGDSYEQAVSFEIQGAIARQSDEDEKAIKFYNDALAIYKDLGWEKDVANVSIRLGNLALKREDYDAAERYQGEALEVAQRTGDKESQAICAGNLGLVSRRRMQWEVARKWYEKALALMQEVGRQDEIARMKYGLSHVHEAEGRADLALPLAQEALKIYERLQHRDLAEVRELVERLGPPP
ncbi:MAG: tetratricopeptide repeat protein [Chloroflexi bacterium]|nr:tetratricopeptide repeat protein [Chloroflexota bacterium]